MACGQLLQTGLMIFFTLQHRTNLLSKQNETSRHFSQCAVFSIHKHYLLHSGGKQHSPLASILKIEISAAFTWLNSAVSSERIKKFQIPQ